MEEVNEFEKFMNKRNKAQPTEAPYEEYLNRIGYFTPSIEDIRVGYEYERYIAGSNTQYEKQIHNLEGDMFLTECYKHGLEEGWIRVPYLTKEQIEAEGWIQEKNYFYKSSTRPLDVNRTYELVYNYEFKQLKISYDCGEFLPWYIFDGFCKDINTFRYICKLLGI